MAENSSEIVSRSFEQLLLPKLQLPRVQKSLLRREHLLTALDEGLEYKVTVIAGPAGSGKTTSVAQWTGERPILPEACRVAYLTLDEGDNDPVRFWRYVIAACQKVYTGIGEEALGLLLAHRFSPLKPLPVQSVLTSLLNELSQVEQSAVLILDDFHELRSSQVGDSLRFFLEHLPTSLHLFLLVRGEPSLSLSRLQVRNEVLNIYPPLLYFSQEETRLFIEKETSFALSVHLLRQIHEKLEGWPAGVRLFASTLLLASSQQEVERVLAAFPGNYHSIQDYFLHEALHTLPQEQQQFLLQTSVFPSVTATLCDEVLGRQDSTQQLAALSRGDLFLIPSDMTGEWRRYQKLFAEAMQQEARAQLGDEQVRTLAILASRWYERHGLLSEAIETALWAEAFTHSAHLIRQYIESGQQHNWRTIPEWHMLKRWLEQLPRDEVERDPNLCLHYATILLFVLMEEPFVANWKERVYSLLDIAEQKWRDANNTAKLAEVFSFHALLTRQEGRMLQAVTWAKQALAWLPSENYMWRSIALTVVGTGEILDGSLKNARTLLLEALTLDEQQGNIAYVRAIRSMLNWVNIEQGRLRLAAEQFHQIQAEARAQEDFDDIAHTQSGLAMIAYEWNNLSEAEQAAYEVLAIGERMNTEEFQASATMRLALIEQARGQHVQAQQRLLAWLAGRTTPATPASYQLQREGQVALARLQLADGDVIAVQRWFEDIEQHDEVLPWLQRGREQLLHTRLLLAQGDEETAIKQLDQLSAEAQQTDHLLLWMEGQLVLCLAYQRKNEQKAQQHLLTLLKTAQSEHYLRLYLDEGEEMAALLRKLLPHIREKATLAYVRHVLSAFDDNAATSKQSTSPTMSALLEPLSVREHQVLRLLAAGNSNSEIAHELVVSVNTIRTQVQSIFRKLNVNNRNEASVVARRLELV